MAPLKNLKDYTLPQLANIRLYGDPDGKQRNLSLAVMDTYKDVVNTYVATLPENQRIQFEGLVRRALDSVPDAEAVPSGNDTSLTKRLNALD